MKAEDLFFPIVSLGLIHLLGLWAASSTIIDTLKDLTTQIKRIADAAEKTNRES